MSRPLSARAVSQTLHKLGYRTVYPDRKRDGMSVRSTSPDMVKVGLSYADPYPDLDELLDEVSRNLAQATGLTCSPQVIDEGHYVVIEVTRGAEA